MEPAGRRILHPPYLEERCGKCHVAPDSVLLAVLRVWPNGVCVSCHLDLAWDFTQADVQHPPGRHYCTTCHEPHGGRVRNLLRDETRLAECAACHEDFLRESQSKPFRHRHFDLRTECGFCHYAHRSGLGKFVKENSAESCLTCHDLGIAMEDGRTLENVKRSLQQAPVVHEAMEQQSCPACHTPHGSDQPFLLTEGYPSGSYEAYSIEQYELCWKCHDPALVGGKAGEGATEFRDGSRNLHGVHLVGLRRGRACHLCHTAHTSQKPHLIREMVAFQEWNAPLGYETFPDGGRCATPCHREKEYHREE